MPEFGGVWSLNRDCLLWRHLDEVVLVYNDRSGATHELGGLQAWTFERLALGSASLDQMVREVFDFADQSNPDEIRRALGETLSLFDRLDLVAAVSTASDDEPGAA